MRRYPKLFKPYEILGEKTMKALRYRYDNTSWLRRVSSPAMIISGETMLFVLNQENMITLLDYVGIDMFKFASTYAQFGTYTIYMRDQYPQPRKWYKISLSYNLPIVVGWYVIFSITDETIYPKRKYYPWWRVKGECENFDEVLRLYLEYGREDLW